MVCLVLLSGKDAASYFTKPEACDSVSRQRCEGIHQGEDWFSAGFLSDALLFAALLHISSSVRVRVIHSGQH